MNAETMKQLLTFKEGLTFECKRIEKIPSRVLPTICAFANTDGGLFVYGLADPKKVEGNRLFGTAKKQDNVDCIRRLIRAEFDPPIPNITMFEESIINKDGLEDSLFIVSVEPSKDVHSLKAGPTYIRNGKRNDALTHKQALQLQYEKGCISFENELLNNVTLKNMDQKLVNDFCLANNIHQNELLKYFLKNGLAEKKDGKILLTYAAVLLFGENPSVLLKRKAGISISHFYGVRATYSDKPNFIRPPFTIEGPLVSQIQDAFEYVAEASGTVQLKGATFKRKKIPPFAIQEAIVNAVIHRDYSIQNDIQIRIFDDRIEVESPGWFPGLVAPETILDDRYARNFLIERTLRKMPNPPNLDIGEGVNRMFEQMDKKNLYVPIYWPKSYSPHAVKVSLFNEERPTHWDSVYKFLKKTGKITNKSFREISGLGTSEASEMLKKWVSRNLLEKCGNSKKGTYYQLPGKRPKEPNLLENGS